jgi:hypothetical protein
MSRRPLQTADDQATITRLSNEGCRDRKVIKRTHRMMLDEYRVKVIERLKGCRDSVVARNILAEADIVLMNGQLTRLTQDKFWETLYEDLEALGEEAKFMTDRAGAVTLSTVIVAAQSRIARYREKIAADEE